MRPAAREAATELRGSLSRHGPVPETFRAALAGILAEERDAWLDLVWGLGELPEDDPHLPRGCVPYLPCPVATMLEAIDVAVVTADDVFVDIGAGVGRATALTHLLTGATCVGLEIQPALVRVARRHVGQLNTDRVRFVEGDAVDLVRRVTTGTVFFMYCPFSGRRVERVLDDLEIIAQTRPIRACCVGMPPLERSWLVEIPSASEDLTVYRSDVAPAR